MIRLSISAVLGITLIAALVMNLSSDGTTGRFMEENGYCRDVLGGVNGYRECGFEVDPVQDYILFKQGGSHTPFYASGEQQYPMFDQGYAVRRRVQVVKSAQYRPGFMVGEDLGAQPINIERANSRRYLSEDPYKGTPWSWKDNGFQ
ncbi:MAG: hypothetical protein AABX47_03415 [Nanoarchaeota archaeon]